MPFTYPTRTCPFCGYPLDGLEWKTNNAVQCPECGQLANPDRLYLLTTKAQLHRRLIFKLLLPTALPTFTVAAAATVDDMLRILGCMLIPVLFMINFLFLITTMQSIFDDTQDEPRPTPRWAIPLWNLLYLLPAIISFYALLAIVAGKFP